MNTKLLAHLGFTTAAGVHIEAGQVHVTRLVVTPLGVLEWDHLVEPLHGEEPVADQVAALLDTLAPNMVGMSLETRECYLATRPMATGGASPSAKVLLRESMRSSSAPVDKMLADAVHARPGKREVVTIAGSARDPLVPLAELADDRRWRLMRAEPAPMSLLRLAGKQRKSRVVHVFLGQEEAISVFAFHGKAMLWNVTPVDHGDEGTLVLSQVRSQTAMAVASGIDGTVEMAVVHGRADLRALVDIQWIEEQLGIPFQWEDGPLPSPEAFASGAAHAVLKQDDDCIDLARNYRRKPYFKEIFPWRELLTYAAMLLAMVMLLQVRRNDLNSIATVVSAQPVSKGQTTKTLERERAALQLRISSAQKFVDTRIPFTGCFRNVTESLPDSVVLTSLSGAAPLESKRGKAKTGGRTLVIKGVVTLAEGGLIPHEIDRLLESLRNNEQLTAEFPNIELADLKQFHQADQDGGEYALFTVVCLPKSRKRVGA